MTILHTIHSLLRNRETYDIINAAAYSIIWRGIVKQVRLQMLHTTVSEEKQGNW
jgi:hypothetical protein